MYSGSFKSQVLTWCARSCCNSCRQGVHPGTYISALLSYSQHWACHTFKSTGQLWWKNYWEECVWLKVFLKI